MRALLWRDIAFCAESAVKPQANKQTNCGSCIAYSRLRRHHWDSTRRWTMSQPIYTDYNYKAPWRLTPGLPQSNSRQVTYCLPIFFQLRRQPGRLLLMRASAEAWDVVAESLRSPAFLHTLSALAVLSVSGGSLGVSYWWWIAALLRHYSPEGVTSRCLQWTVNNSLL